MTPRLCGTWIPSVQNVLMDTAVLCGQSHSTSCSHLELNSDISSQDLFFIRPHFCQWKICRRPVKSLLFTIWGIHNNDMDHFDFSVVSQRRSVSPRWFFRFELKRNVSIRERRNPRVVLVVSENHICLLIIAQLKVMLVNDLSHKHTLLVKKTQPVLAFG